jgi:hypothetical protein
MPTGWPSSVPGRTVTFRDGTSVAAVRLADRRVEHPRRDFGLYLDRRWAPTWPAAVIDWPDYGLPPHDWEAIVSIREAFRRAQAGEYVEVGCAGALGRTGTVFACMAILAGERPEDAVAWVRTAYDRHAVETPEQEAWVVTFGTWERVWCDYRNLVHTVYREVRHLGTPIDPDARCQVAEHYWPAARQCRQHRRTLQSTVPFRRATGSRTDDMLHGYKAFTGLTPEDLVVIFRGPGWQAQYGGERWAHITEVLVRLKREIDQGVVDAAWQIHEEVHRLHHNSGPLVPSPELWRKNAWVREKWPVLCEGQG